MLHEQLVLFIGSNAMRSAAAVSVMLTIASCMLANELPNVQNKIPRFEDFDRKRKLSGLIPNREELMKRPRVIIGYLSEKDWAITEFLCFMHASWRYVTSLAEPTGYRLDLMVFSDLHWFRDVASLCEPLTLVDVIADEKGEAEADGSEGGSNSKGSVSHLQGGGAVGLVGGRHGGGTGEYPQLRRQGNKSTCWVVPYPPPPESVWQGYPFVASYHFLADPRVAHLLTSNFGYALKTDFDCFVTPTLIQHFPWQLEVGYMHYTPVLETKQRLQRVAAGLGLRHRGHHDIGPTWYGDVATLIAVANASIPLVYHLLDREFGGEPDGSWRRKWAAGEGWPLWSKDMAVMYATDLVLNHLVETFHISQKYDVHGDSQRYTFTLYHIHCQHGDGNFSKFEFFMHKYRDRDITVGLDFNRVRDYSLVLSVATWRQLAAGKIGAQANGSIITKAGKGPVCAENGGGDVRGPDGGGGGDSADAGIAQEGAGDGKAPPHSEL